MPQMKILMVEIGRAINNTLMSTCVNLANDEYFYLVEIPGQSSVYEEVQKHGSDAPREIVEALVHVVKLHSDA
jgi:hypothetical protein